MHCQITIVRQKVEFAPNSFSPMNVLSKELSLIDCLCFLYIIVDNAYEPQYLLYHIEFSLKIIWFLPSQMHQQWQFPTFLTTFDIPLCRRKWEHKFKSWTNRMPSHPWTWFHTTSLVGQEKKQVLGRFCVWIAENASELVLSRQYASLEQILPCCQPVMQKPPAENKNFAKDCSITQFQPDLKRDVFILVLHINAFLCQPEIARFNGEASSNVCNQTQ